MRYWTQICQPELLHMKAPELFKWQGCKGVSWAAPAWTDACAWPRARLAASPAARCRARPPGSPAGCAADASAPLFPTHNNSIIKTRTWDNWRMTAHYWTMTPLPPTQYLKPQNIAASGHLDSTLCPSLQAVKISLACTCLVQSWILFCCHKAGKQMHAFQRYHVRSNALCRCTVFWSPIAVHDWDMDPSLENFVAGPTNDNPQQQPASIFLNIVFLLGALGW